MTRAPTRPDSGSDSACKTCIAAEWTASSRAKTFDNPLDIRILCVDGLYDPAFAGHIDESIVTSSTYNCPFRNAFAEARPRAGQILTKGGYMPAKKAKKAVKKTAKKKK